MALDLSKRREVRTFLELWRAKPLLVREAALFFAVRTEANRKLELRTDAVWLAFLELLAGYCDIATEIDRAFAADPDALPEELWIRSRQTLHAIKQAFDVAQTARHAAVHSVLLAHDIGEKS